MKQFTPEEQIEYQKAYVAKCRGEAWDGFCHADWILHGLNEMEATAAQLTEDAAGMRAEAKKIEGGLDYHTVANRDKVAELYDKADQVDSAIAKLSGEAKNGYKVREGIIVGAEGKMSIAEYAEKWTYTEPKPAEPGAKP